MHDITLFHVFILALLGRSAHSAYVMAWPLSVRPSVRRKPFFKPLVSETTGSNLMKLYMNVH